MYSSGYCCEHTARRGIHIFTYSCVYKTTRNTVTFLQIYIYIYERINLNLILRYNLQPFHPHLLNQANQWMVAIHKPCIAVNIGEHRESVHVAFPGTDTYIQLVSLPRYKEEEPWLLNINLNANNTGPYQSRH